MSDLEFADKLCSVKKYTEVVKDRSLWGPVVPRVELKTADMDIAEKTILEELINDYTSEIESMARYLLKKHRPRGEKWNLDDQDKEEILPELSSAMLWVIHKLLRLSCNYEEIGKFGLRGYFLACFKKDWNTIDWRRFIDDVDTNVPVYIRKLDDLDIKIYRKLRKAKKWSLDEPQHFAQEFNLDENDVRIAYHKVIESCMKHGHRETRKILRDYSLQYDEAETTEDGSTTFNQEMEILKESLRVRSGQGEIASYSDQDRLLLLNSIKVPLNKIIKALKTTEWQLLDLKYDANTDHRKIIDRQEDIYVRIRNELKIKKPKDIDNRIGTIVKKVFRRFKEGYPEIVESHGLQESTIKMFIDDYYFSTREKEN